jgi:ABC-type polysaccharide/polyol phosphate export permease
MKVARDLRELIGYRELIAVLALREIRARYRYSLLGVGWAVALPVSLMLIFSLVFSKVASFQTGGIPYPLFAYAGLLPWQLHAGMLTGGARSLTDNSTLVTKVYFAREVLPLSRVLAALFDFSIASLVLVGMMIWYGVVPGPAAALLPLVLLVQIAFGVGLAMIIAAANLLFRDTQYVLQVAVTVWMFASSVVYPLPRQGTLGWLGYVNPITPILDAYRALLLGAPAPDTGQLVAAVAISVSTLLFGWLWFRRVEARFGELA